jgi:MOSC domain-containing protein YiiM
MKTFEQLVELWQAAPATPADQAVVRGICVRLGGGRHARADQVEVTLDQGVVGDRWSLAADPERLSQVTIMNAVVAESIAHAGTPGADAGDNFIVDLDLSETALPIGARVRLGSALLEVTPEPHLGCGKFNERFGAGALRWVNHKAHRELRLRGVNLRVLEGGRVQVGDRVEVVTR